jgi:signal transduction histidine kinase
MRHTGANTSHRDADGAASVIEERLRLIIDTIPTIVWRKSPDGSADFFNKHFRESPCLGRMTPDVEMALFRVVQESLTNIQRHAGNSQAKIRIERDPGRIALEISDKGSGIPGNLGRQNGKLSFGLGVGIPSMQERVKLIGRRLDIESGSSGTMERATIPPDD